MALPVAPLDYSGPSARRSPRWVAWVMKSVIAVGWTFVCFYAGWGLGVEHGLSEGRASVPVRFEDARDPSVTRPSP